MNHKAKLTNHMTELLFEYDNNENDENSWRNNSKYMIMK